MYAAATVQGLVAAGGHHFVNGIPWWDGGSKGWSDAIYVLDRPSGTWRTCGEKLPRPLGDGVAVAHGDGMICAGGGDAMQAYRDVFLLRWSGDRIETVMLPPLPTPRLKMGGARLGDIFYLAGGRDHPGSPVALHAFVALDLSRPAGQRKWASLPAWPGPPRMMPVVAVTADSLYVFGGIEIVPDAQGKPKNVAPYLSDAYRYRPDDGTGRWEKLANLPRPVAGAPTPAWMPDKNTILIFGGVDGAIEAVTDRSSVRALPDDILEYDIERDAWRVAGRIGSPMVPRVNAPAVPWHGGYVIVSGEHLPARRTNAVTFVTTLPPDAMPAK
jgi:N-acetylneuraminic acid mutarotase